MSKQHQLEDFLATMGEIFGLSNVYIICKITDYLRPPCFITSNLKFPSFFSRGIPLLAKPSLIFMLLVRIMFLKISTMSVLVYLFFRTFYSTFASSSNDGKFSEFKRVLFSIYKMANCFGCYSFSRYFGFFSVGYSSSDDYTAFRVYPGFLSRSSLL